MKVKLTLKSKIRTSLRNEIFCTSRMIMRVVRVFIYTGNSKIIGNGKGDMRWLKKRKIFGKYSFTRYLDVNSFFFYFSHPFIRIPLLSIRDISFLIIIINFARSRTEKTRRNNINQTTNPPDLDTSSGRCISVCERERKKN